MDDFNQSITIRLTQKQKRHTGHGAATPNGRLLDLAARGEVLVLQLQQATFPTQHQHPTTARHITRRKAPLEPEVPHRYSIPQRQQAASRAPYPTAAQKKDIPRTPPRYNTRQQWLTWPLGLG